VVIIEVASEFKKKEEACQHGNGKEQPATFGPSDFNHARPKTLTLHFTARGLSRPTATRQEKPKKSKTGPKNLALR
jgi:hypothetical protein